MCVRMCVCAEREPDICLHLAQEEVIYRFNPSALNYDRLQDAGFVSSFLQLSSLTGAGGEVNITVETLLAVGEGGREGGERGGGGGG